MGQRFLAGWSTLAQPCPVLGQEAKSQGTWKPAWAWVGFPPHQHFLGGFFPCLVFLCPGLWDSLNYLIPHKSSGHPDFPKTFKDVT